MAVTSIKTVHREDRRTEIRQRLGQRASSSQSAMAPTISLRCKDVMRS